jgi:hypothetical protein
MSPVGAPHVMSAAVTPAEALDVVCAWPVSGQYGPGSRILYYVLVATCILGRRVEWLRNAALAVALVFPAVAALHALVLAAVHVNGWFLSHLFPFPTPQTKTNNSQQVPWIWTSMAPSSYAPSASSQPPPPSASRGHIKMHPVETPSFCGLALSLQVY